MNKTNLKPGTHLSPISSSRAPARLTYPAIQVFGPPAVTIASCAGRDLSSKWSRGLHNWLTTWGRVCGQEGLYER